MRKTDNLKMKLTRNQMKVKIKKMMKKTMKSRRS